MQFRHEMKHEISQADMLALRARLSVVCQRDPHAINGKYFIRSLYFDTPGDTALREKLNDDNPNSYSNIFGSAKTDVSDADKTRLISSLKSLSSYENLENVVDIEQVISYFVVHNFVDNGDSYTGSMIHNYYLHEENGALSMIPWDYNLAYGTFQSSNASTSVNKPIDTPVSGGGNDRPMIGWIFSDESYTELYHQYFNAFMEQFFDSGWLENLIDDTVALISPYVEKDPTKFCTYEAFVEGAATIKSYCLLRAESVKGQLDGTIPSTSAGQNADSSTLVNTDGLTLSKRGTMGMGGGFGGNRTDRTEGTQNMPNWQGSQGTSGAQGSQNRPTSQGSQNMPNTQGSQSQRPAWGDRTQKQ